MDRSKVVKISKAKADEARLRILEAISAADHINCGEIVAMRGVTAATVSHHLKVLSEAGLIACRRKGSSSIARPSPKLSQPMRGSWRKARPKKAAQR